MIETRTITGVELTGETEELNRLEAKAKELGIIYMHIGPSMEEIEADMAKHINRDSDAEEGFEESIRRMIDAIADGRFPESDAAPSRSRGVEAIAERYPFLKRRAILPDEFERHMGSAAKDFSFSDEFYEKVKAAGPRGLKQLESGEWVEGPEPQVKSI